MKYALILWVTLFSGAALAGNGIHNFSSSDNPHAKGGCASKNGNIAQFHRFHNKDWKNSKSEKKVDTNKPQQVRSLKDFI